LDTDYDEFDKTHSIHDNSTCITKRVDAAEDASLKTFEIENSLADDAKAALIVEAETVYKTSTAKDLFETVKQQAVSKLREDANFVVETGTNAEKLVIQTANNVKKISLMAALKNQAKQNQVNARQMREDRRTKRKQKAGEGVVIDVAPTKPTKAILLSKTAKTKYAVETRAIVLESKMVIEKNDLPDFMASSLLTTTKPIAYVFADAYVANESPDEDCKTDGVEVCCTFDIATDSDSTILVAVDEVIGAWSVLCDGTTIISKQTRTSNTDSDTGIAVYDMQCWDGTDFANTTQKNSGETLECPNYTVIIGSEGTSGVVSNCDGTVLGPDATGVGNCTKDEKVDTTCIQVMTGGTCTESTCGANNLMTYGTCTSNSANPVCLHPDVPVHVLTGLSVQKVAVKTLKPGDLVIGEGRTSAVKRVETFQVEDEACVVPKDLCGGFAEQVLVSKTHAIRCPEWPANTWTFCQPEWPRVATTEYVHVELESYLKDHILSGSIVLESWDGYARESDTIEDACSKRGCPWPHKWESTDEKRWKRVDLRQEMLDSTPRLRIKR
tara:strand:+ start:19907 stop:21571 length:1665 start_codon:yes stop_codon:yes gene_type:complete